MSRYPFKTAGLYRRNHVIDVIERHIQNGTYKNEEVARAWVSALRQSPHDSIRWTPSTERGFGCSPMNPNNWQTEVGEPIWQRVTVSVKDLR